MHYARGKTLGGSSARNYLVYHRFGTSRFCVIITNWRRPTKASLEHWATQVGDSSFKYENFLPYFKKSIQYTPPKAGIFTNSSVETDPSAFSNNTGDGLLQVSYVNFVDAFDTWVQPALVKSGMHDIDGFNSGNLIGSAYATFTIKPSTAQRSSSESSFLQRAVQNTTLKVYKNSLAQKILFQNKTAKGVAVTTNGTDYVLRATKEVIVSAGALQSPQILMVSGIGPKETLKRHGIPVLKDLPGVGQNLWDQPRFASTFRVNAVTGSTLQNDPVAYAAAVKAYQTEATGPLSIAAGGVLGFEKLPPKYRSSLSASTLDALAQFPADWPEIEWLPSGHYLGNQGNYQTADPADGYNYASLQTSLLAPLSRGNVSINSSRMQDPPTINPNWLTDPADIEVAIAVFKRQRELWTLLSNITLGEERLPGQAVESDSEILSYIRSTVAPIWHAAGTCKMGRANDTMAVIDSSARVFGTQGLRVVDASSFPFLPPGHPQSTVYALAEKVSKQILDGR